MYRVLLCLILLMGMLVVVAPVAAQSPCNPGMVHWVADRNVENSNGTLNRPFTSQAKAEEYLMTTVGGGCVYEVRLNQDDEFVRVDPPKIIKIPVKGLGDPVAQEVILLLLAGSALVLISGGVWMRRRHKFPVGI